MGAGTVLSSPSGTEYLRIWYHVVMPALNVRFTDAELAQLRERAEATGVSMQALAHDAIVNDCAQSGQDERWMASIARVTGLSRTLLDRLADL